MQAFNTHWSHTHMRDKPLEYLECRAGDCGPFTLKYIECHALGIEFPSAFDKKHGKTIREKMALNIFRELPMCHEWENQDNDENLATYD
ncbi:unnamed protein product [Brassica napus]|uniref:(rape) hypothetical protein n=1 Tax=Brassica napus TaxID=3708 RepID=A0A816QFT6_BRANA|nr:unnamed protein product [Brassica napus]